MLRFDRRFIAPLAAALVLAAPLSLQAQIAILVAGMTVSSSANPATYAAPLTFTVAVTSPVAGTSVPTGVVSATLDGLYPLGSAALDGAGRAVIAVPQNPGLFFTTPWGLGAGANAITFSYSGDAHYGQAQSTFTQFIGKANTITTASVGGNVQPVSLSATVKINEPSVTTVAFGLPGNSAGNSAGGAGSAPGGTVQFFNGTVLLGTATLAPASLFTSTATLPAAVTPANLIAVYSGDADYNGSTSASAVQSGAGAVTLTASSSANPSVFAAPVTLTIAVAPAVAGGPAPTGFVSASNLGLFALGSATLDATGQGTLTVPKDPGMLAMVPWGFGAGSNSILLTYSGDARYAPAQTTFTQVVDKADTATTAATQAAATAAGLSVRATVSISEPSVTPTGFNVPGGTAGSAPTGSVQFTQGGAPTGAAALSASGLFQSTATLAANPVVSPAVPSAGDIVAVYSGDANYNGSTSPPAGQQNRGAVTITVTSSVNPSTFAEPVTFSVTVAPAVAGGPVAGGGVAGGALAGGGAAGGGVAGGGVAGGGVASGAVPTGTVNASAGQTLGHVTLDATGHASFTVPTDSSGLLYTPWGLATGSIVITVTYSGDSNYSQGQTTFNQIVNKADTTTRVILAPVAFGATSFTIAATVSIDEASVSTTGFGISSAGNVSTSPTGNVNFFDGATLLGTVALTPGANFRSEATLTTGAVPASVRAVYSGDTNYNGSSSSGPAPTAGAPVTIALASSANPVAYGARLTIAATVAPATPGGPTPTGTVTFFDGSRNLGWIATLDSTGRGAMPIPEPLATPLVCAPTCPAAAWVMVLSARSHTITATYSGDANYAGLASGDMFPPVSLVQSITPAPSVTKVSEACEVLGIISQCFAAATVADAQPPAGGLFHFMTMGASGLVDGNPSGTVQFLSGSTAIGKGTLAPSTVSNVTSTASLATSTGIANLTAIYSGDANFPGSSSTGPAKTATSVTVSSNLNPSGVGQTITLIATVSPDLAILEPTGSVSFLDGAKLLGQAPFYGGAATLTATFTTTGTHSLTATYSGDTNYLPSTSATYSQSVTSQGGTYGVLSLTASSTTAVFGQQVVFFVGVTGSGTTPAFGDVSLLDGAIVVGGGSLSLGSAEVILTLPVGAHQISAVWAGDENWPPAKSAVLVFVVNRAATVTTLVPSGPAALLAAVAVERPGGGTPTGTIQFIDATDQAVLATVPLTVGSAQLLVNPFSLYPGLPDPIYAVYSGDTDFTPSASAPADLPGIVNMAGAIASALAPDEIATIYGANLANATTAAALPLPTSLAGASVTATDSAGASRLALLYYASPNQVNFVVPAGTASGPASIAAAAAGAGFSVNVTISPVAPTLFSVAQIVAVHPDGTQTVEGTAAPIVFGSDSLYLVLYATGVRNRSSLGAVTCTIGSLNLPVTYAGAQSQYPGLDQVVVALPASLRGAGAVYVLVTADGHASNAVSIAFQ